MKSTPRQKDLSIYILVAIVQSYLWLFVVPEIVRPQWSKIFDGIPYFMKEVILNQTSTIIFVVYGVFILPVYYLQLPFFEQFKINKKEKWPWLDDNEEKRNKFWKLTKKSAMLSFFNLVILVTVATIGLRYIMNIFGISGPSFDFEDWPTTMELIRDNFLITIIHEFGFYSTHRLMHTYPSLYKYHKVHHEYKSNVFHASQHNHPVDHIISIATPAVLAMNLVQPHSFTQFHWIIYAMYTNIDDHVGYCFPFSAVRWFPFAALTEEHEFHHSVNIGCFSSKLNIYEKLFGTNKKFHVWDKKRVLVGGNKSL